ncbi:MAG: mechanosensitive ion channel [Calditrichaeota bacterium]|nr:mechanosensitive ion channel [Calditrichota bacterium]HQU73325.1 mechanosensitive ion channel [Calditrichia bacterium]
MIDFKQYSDTAVELVMLYTPKVLLALLTLFVGLWMIKVVIKTADKGMEKAEMDVSLRRFLVSLSRMLLKAVLIISVAGMVGIETTSFVAILGAAGLAIGLALQGSLANFAGGVLILIFKPFTVGDFIEGQGHSGTVHSIQVFNTVLKTADNKTIIIPNGQLSSGSIVNFSAEATRRVDMLFGIGYGDDIPRAKAVLTRLMAEESRILPEPAPQLVLKELGDSSVNFEMRVWANKGDYWGIYFEMLEKVKLTFDREGISIPFPQRDVHVYQEKN